MFGIAYLFVIFGLLLLLDFQPCHACHMLLHLLCRYFVFSANKWWWLRDAQMFCLLSTVYWVRCLGYSQSFRGVKLNIIVIYFGAGAKELSRDIAGRHLSLFEWEATGGVLGIPQCQPRSESSSRLVTWQINHLFLCLMGSNNEEVYVSVFMSAH